MAGTGSNDLNLLLKARVVKLKVVLDAKGSNLPTQVNGISKMLADKPVKLKVKLDASITDLNKQISGITKLLGSAKTFKPLEIDVKLNMKSSVDVIKKQLKEAYDVLTDFNKKYAKQIQQMQTYMATPPTPKVPKGTNVPTNAGVENFNNIKQYANQMAEAERILRSKFADKAGLFGSQQLKDAKGNMLGFIASLERANGVVEKIRYSYNQSKNRFDVVDRNTMTQTDKMVHKAVQSLADLERELEKAGSKARQFKTEYANLMSAGHSKTLTGDAVKDFQTRLKNAVEENRLLKEKNQLRRDEAKLLRDIREATKSAQKDPAIRSQTQALVTKARGANDAQVYKDVRLELTNLKDKVSEYNNKAKEQASIVKQKQQAFKELTRYLRETNESSGALDRANIRAVQTMAQRATSTKQMIAVQKQLQSMEKQQANIKNQDAREQALQKLKKTMIEMASVTGREVATIEARFKQLERNIGGNLANINQQIKTYEKTITKAKNASAIDTLQRRANAVVAGTMTHNSSGLRNLINGGDITAIKNYIGQWEKLNIATAKIRTNAKGVSTITTTLESTGKTARQVTYEIDNLTGKLRRLGTQDVFNRNANLGIFEQLKIALQRVPTWFLSTTAFYGSIHVFQDMAGEILKVDKALTELKRVASDNINIDTVFKGAISLSKELGNNIHDIMQAVNDLSRTYGDFNERQLLAVAKTAVLMSNVSDLTAQEATNTLVGTMNAFNIVAEDSIRIVDSLNEVDNDYAISTKQLAEGLQKSASTARTFGVEMEENVGHITAIGAVTMESGAIIGNSLKTIYSRITTIGAAKDILESVNVGLYQIGETGQKEIKPVNDILADLAGKWGTLSKEQQQNISVTVAGRYQLSRFLALMNNYQMGVDATRTALSAQGSAMRENAKYMDSFEARINKLKNAFTEMSLSVGEAFLSGAILTGIEALAGLAKVAMSVANSIGALPVVFAVIGIIMFKMKMFDASIGKTIFALQQLRTAYITTATASGRFAGAMAVAGGVVRGASGAIVAGFTAIKTAVRGLLASTGIGLIFVGIGYGLEKLIGWFDKSKRSSEKVEKANKALVDSYRNTAGGLDALIDKQAELQRRVDTGNIKEGTEAYNEYVKVTNDLAQKMPSIVKYIDQSGLAHLRETDAIKEQLKYAEKLSKLQYDVDKGKYEETLNKHLEGYAKETEAIEKLAKKLKELKEQDGKTSSYTDEFGNRVEVKGMKNDTSKQQQANLMETLQHEQKKQEYIQKTMNLVQNTTMAYLESDKKLKNLTDSGKTVIENMVQVNEELLRYTKKGNEMVENDEKTIKKRADQLLKLGQDLGGFMSSTYESMTKGVDDPMKIKEITTNIDTLIKTLPSTFFKVESLNNVDALKDKFKGILDIADQVKNGANDFDALTQALRDQGFTADEAKGYVSQLSLQYKNAELRQKAMTQAQNEGQTSLEDWVDTAISAIDVSERLFGLNDEDLGAIKSHVETLQGLQAMYGENAKNTEQWQESIQAVSLFTGIPDDVIAKDLNYWRNSLGLMENVELQYDENTGALVGFNKEGLNQGQIKILENMIHLGKEHGVTIDLLTGKMYDLKTGQEMVYDDNGTPIPITTKAEEASKALDETKKKMQETKQQEMWNKEDQSAQKVKKDAEEVGAKVDEVKQKFTEQKLRKLYNEEDTSAEKVKNDGEQVKLTIDEIKQKFHEQKMMKLYNEGDTSASTTKTKIDDVGKSIDETKKKMQDMKMQKIFDEENENFGGNTKAKVDELTEAIKKATDGTKLLNDLNIMVGNSTTNVEGLLTKLTNLKTGMDSIVQNGGSIGQIKQSIENMAGALLIVQEKIGAMFSSVSTGASNLATPIGVLKQNIESIGISLDIARAKAGAFTIAMSVLGSVQVGNLSSLTTQLGLLSHNLVLASQYGQGTAQAQQAVILAFQASAQAVLAYNSVISGLNSTVGASFSALASLVQQAIASMIQSYALNVVGQQAMVRASLNAVAGMVTVFAMGASILRGTMTSMTTQMYNAFVSGMNVIVTSASSLPKRIGDAIRGNMGYVVSAMRQLQSTVANTTIQANVRQTKVGAYAKGGIVDKMELAWHGEEGAEAIIPLISKRRKRGIELWEEAGKRLGIPTELIGYLSEKTSKRKSKGGVAGSGGSFGSSSGEGGGVSGGGDSGSSGTLVSPSYNLGGGYNANGGYNFNALADEGTEIADLVDVDWNARILKGWESALSVLEAKMQGMNENTKQYRDSLKEIIRLENGRLNMLHKSLKADEASLQSVSTRLSQLSNVNSHTKEQRDEYNKLQQEYDSLIDKIASLKTEIETTNNKIVETGKNIFTDWIAEITVAYDNMIKGFQSGVDNIEFRIDVAELIDPDNMEKKLDLLAEKATELQSQLAVEQGKKEDLTKRLADAIKSYGAESDQAKAVKEQLEQAEEAWEDTTIAVLQAEKEIRDARGEVADEGIDQLKDYYSNMQDMAVEAIELEKKQLEDAHEAKMELYDEEVDKINSVYDAKIKSMDADKEQSNYEEELADKNTKKAELMNKIALLSRDNTLEGRKKLAELQKELTDVNKDIADFQSDRQDDLLRQQLEEQKEAQIEALNAQKEAEQKTHDEQIAGLDKDKAETEKYYGDILNDEKYWADMKSQFVAGNFAELTNELTTMSSNLSAMNEGNFDMLSKSFASFSDSVKKEIAELYGLTVDNAIFNSSGAVDAVGQVDKTKYDFTNAEVASEFAKYSEFVNPAPVPSTPAPSPNPKPTPAPPAPAPAPRYHTVAKGDTLWDLAQQFYGNPYKWSTIANANGSPDPRKLQIGRKLLIPFRDGGFTGDWSGQDGKIAMLHKKEQVFKKEDTRNLLDASKIMRAVVKYMPDIKRNSVGDKFAMAGGITGNITSYGDIIVNVEGGDRKKAKDIAKEIMTSLKKKGK